MVTIALVLRTGGVYDYKYVNNLVNGIKDNINVPHKIVCLTNDNSNLSEQIDEIIPFKHDWSKWWGKIELFRPDLFNNEQVFYIDLDTFIVDDISKLVSYRGEFCALRDFYNLDEMGSGLMSWHGDRVHKIYNEFLKNPQHFMKSLDVGGDQVFIRKFKPTTQYFQDIFPSEVVSYKVNCLKGSGAEVPNQAKIICFHGNPRPHTIDNNLIKYWKY